MRFFSFLFAALFFSHCTLFAQSESTESQPAKVFTAGVLFFGDAAYLSAKDVPVRSGFAMSAARLRASLTFGRWYFYADMDFSYGRFSQKHIFMRYALPKLGSVAHYLRAGYFFEPTSMARNIGSSDLNFLAIAAPAAALSPSRALGVAYSAYGHWFFASQGFFAENANNLQKVGSQGFSASCRWLFKPLHDTHRTAHIGFGARYGSLRSGVQSDDGVLTYSTPFESSVDRVPFVRADIPWARHAIHLNGEFLFMYGRFFARGEYMHNIVGKRRDDAALFAKHAVESPAIWATLEAWQADHPIRSSQFSGGYLELGWQLLGTGYAYNPESSVLRGCNASRTLQLLGRYSFTNLDDITEGDVYVAEKRAFFPLGQVSNRVSSSIAGGKLHMWTLGLMYTFNRHAKLLASYSFAHLAHVSHPHARMVHIAQGRIMFSF